MTSGFGRGKALVQHVPDSIGYSSNTPNQQNGFGGAPAGGFGAAPSGGGGGGGGFKSSFGADSSADQQNGFGTSGGFGAGSFGGGGRGGGGGGGGDRACRNCNQEGHFARECPQRGSGGGGGRGGGECFKCGQPGHRSVECTNVRSDGGGQSRGAFGGNREGGGAFGGNKGFGDASSGGFGGDNADGGFGGRSKPSGGGGGFGFGGGASSDAPSGGGGFGSGGGGGGFGSGGGGGRSGGGFGASGGGGGSGCRKCGEEGHFARDCPQGGGGSGDNKCRKCGEEGHFARDCPNAAAGGGGGGGDGCRRCGSTTHQVRDCPKPMTCFNCQQEGHQSKDCPNPKVERPLAEGQKPPQTYQPKEITEDDLNTIQRIHTGINFEKYDNVKVQLTGSGEGTQAIQSFAEAGLTETILANVVKANFTKPTPIQKQAIPIIMAGHDLMACAQTGSGKTAAYLLPVLTCMVKRGELSTAASEVQEPSAIIVTPTRELAIQISTEAKFFAKGTIINVCLLYGGTNVRYQMDQIRRGCNVLVATPGRLNHFITSGNIGLGKCRYVILDEADRMLDMGFESEVRKIVDGANMPMKTDRQTLMFSATFPDEIQKLAQDFLKNQFAFIAVGIVGGANCDITQEIEQVGQYDKKERLIELLRQDLENSIPTADGKYAKKTLVFVERKRVADFTATYLSEMEFKATSIHGDREQQQREEALGDFKRGRCPVLVATAVAARGLDIVGVDHVINYDMPSSIDDYVHRIGRTGRVGNPGRATSFFDDAVDQPLASQLVQILSDAQQTVPDWLQKHVSGIQGYSTDRSMFGGRDSRDANGDWNSRNAGGSTFSAPANDKWE